MGSICLRKKKNMFMLMWMNLTTKPGIQKNNFADHVCNKNIWKYTRSINTVFPEYNQRMELELILKSKNIGENVYRELEDSDRGSLIRNYHKKIEEYIQNETEHVDIDNNML